MIPRVGETIDPRQRYTLRPGAYAILPRGRSILLTVQIDDNIDVQLPGGGIDPGEAPIAALHREVLEETGWSISSPRRIGAMRRFVFMPEYDLWAEKLCTIYLAHPARKISEPTEDHHEVLWLPIHDAVHALGNEGDRAFLQKFVQS